MRHSNPTPSPRLDEKALTAEPWRRFGRIITAKTVGGKSRGSPPGYWQELSKSATVTASAIILKSAVKNSHSVSELEEDQKT